jgi:hypothetical protein
MENAQALAATAKLGSEPERAQNPAGKSLHALGVAPEPNQG